MTDSVHIGSYKQVSPFFTLYRTSPYLLRSQVIDPVYKGGPTLCAQFTPPPKSTSEPCEDEGAVESEGAEGGEEWSLECLRTTLTGDSIDYLSPVASRETSNSSRTGVCEDRPLSLTDFGNSLFECEQAEEDFRKLSMELTDPDEVSQKRSPAQQTTNDQLALATSEFTVRTEHTGSTQIATRGVDEGPHRLYKVLYGYDVESMDLEAQHVLIVSSALQAVRKDEVQHAASPTKGSDNVSNSIVGADDHRILISEDLNNKLILRMNQTLEDASQELADPFFSCKRVSDSVTQASNRKGFENEHIDSVDFVSGISGFETKSFRLNPSLSEMEEPGYESLPGMISCLQSSSPDRLSSPECATDSVIFLSDSRASSPESVSSVNEQNFLSPDSPAAQFRPLSPLPPPFLSWELGEERTAAGKPKGALLLLTSDAEERPLTPMVSNRKPFGSPVSPFSDYSGEQSMLPQALGFEMEDRASSPDSVIAETLYCFFEPDHHDTHGVYEVRSLSQSDAPVQSQTEFKMAHGSVLSEDLRTSPESSAPISEYKALPTDSPVMELSRKRPDPIDLNPEDRFGLSESDLEPSCVSPGPFYYENTALSSSSVSSANEFMSLELSDTFTASSAKSTDIMLASKPDNLNQADKSLSFDALKKQQTLTKLQCANEDDEVIISLCDLEEKPISADSVPKYRPMSPQSALFDIRTHSPELDTVNEHLPLDSLLPQYMSYVHHAVMGTSYASSPESVLDVYYEAMSLVSHSEDRPFSPESCSSEIDDGLSAHPETNQLLCKEFTFELKQAAVLQEESTLRMFETIQRTESEKVETGKSSARMVKQNLYKTELLRADSIQQDQNIVPELEKPELLSTDDSRTELPKVFSEAKESNEEVYRHVKEKVKHITRQKLKKVLKDQMDVRTETPLKTEMSDETFLLCLSQQPTVFPSSRPSSKTEQSPSGYSLAYDAEPCRLISQIYDPQYSGETFRSKEGKMQHYGTPSNYNQEKSAIDDKTNALQMYRRSLLPVPEAQSWPLSPESLMLLETVRPYPSLSDRSASSHQDSPVAQFQTSFIGSSTLCVRSVSPETVLSDLGIESNLNVQIFGDRPSSPDSVSSISANMTLSIDSPIPSFKTFFSESFIHVMSDYSSVQSVYSDDEHGFDSLESLSIVNRPPSVNSVDENGPLSHESPVPELGQSLSKTHLTTWKRCCSPVSLCSDELSSFSVESLFDESRPPSVDSVDENYPLSPGSPIPELRQMFIDSHAPTTLEGSVSPVSVSSDKCCRSASLETLFGESRPPSIGSFDEDRLLSPESPIPAFEEVVLDYDLSGLDRYSSSDSVTSDIEYGCISFALLFDERRSPSPDSVDEKYCLMPESPIPEFSQVLLDCHVSTTLQGSLSPFSLASNVKSCSVSLESLFGESRSPSINSLDKSRPLSPESPIADFGEIIVETDLVTLERYSSPVSATSDIEFGFVSLASEFNVSRQTSVDSANQSFPVSLDSPITEFGHNLPEVHMNKQQRSLFPPSSPDSVLSGGFYRGDLPVLKRNSGFTESLRFTERRFLSPELDMSDVEYTQSDINKHISEQRSDSPKSQSPETLMMVQLSTVSLKETRVPVFKLVYDKELWKLISQVRDPQYVGETFCSKTGFFEYVGTRNEHVPEAPEIRIRELEDHLKSDNAELESRSLSPLEMTTNVQTCCSPFKDVCLDSQVPKFSCDHPKISQSLNLQTLTISDGGSKNSMFTNFSESRPSTGSALSVDDQSALTPDSRLPDFRPLVTESVITGSGYRTSSPYTEFSDVEYGLLMPSTFTEKRPDSPELLVCSSIQNQSKDVTRIRQLICSLYDPQYAGDVSRSRVALSDNIETSIKVVSLDLSTENMGRLISPDSEAEDRPLSPETIPVIKCNFQDKGKSADETSKLSTDSPIPRFSLSQLGASVTQTSTYNYICDAKPAEFEGPEFHKSDKIIDEDRYLSSESLSFDLEYLSGFTTAEVWIQERLFSPHSGSSETEMHPMPPPSLMLLTETKISSPNSATFISDLHTPSPDSLQFFQNSESAFLDSGSKSSYTTRSMTYTQLQRLNMPFSEVKYTGFTADSESDHMMLSPDSPVPDFSQFILHPAVVLSTESRSCSPEAVCSSDIEHGESISVSISDEYRPVSPGSVISEDDCQTTSLDLGITKVKAEVTERFPSFVGFKSESPASVPSHLEYAPLISILRQPRAIPDPSNSETNPERRPLSPDSESESRSFSPVSLTFIFKSTSPESVGSLNELRTLSPDSPIPEFRVEPQDSIKRYSEHRSSSPESVSSDREVEMNLGTMFFEEQCPSHDTVASGRKYKNLPVDSPIPDFRPFLSFTHVDDCCYSVSSFECNHSDLDHAPFISQLFEDEAKERPNSPASDLFLHEYQHLSPDSSIPQYTHWEANTVTYGSASPGSVYSNDELETELCKSRPIEDRETSPSLSSSKSESRPDSHIPDLVQVPQESFHALLRSTSPTSLCSGEESDLEPDVSIPSLFEDRAVTPGSTISQDEFRPDSPVPEFTSYRARIRHINALCSSSEIFGSDENLEIDTSMTWLFEDRASSPGSTTSKDELEALSPDSPIPTFTQIPEEPIISLLASWSTSPESVNSDLEMELSSSVIIKDHPTLPLSLTPQSHYGLILPDSPVPDFTQDFFDTFYTIDSNSPSSPKSEASEIEYAPLISQIFDFEDGRESCSPGQSDDIMLQYLSPDSPLPHYSTDPSSYIRLRHMSISPELEFSEEDLETDLCIPWHFEKRTASPCSTISKEELRLLSPDSPIPIFRQHDSIIPNLYQRSKSPESVFSDLEMPSEFHTLTQSRPSSPDSLISIRLSPNSPLPDLEQPLFKPPKTIFRSWSISPESTCSEVEYIVLSLGSMCYDNRPSSPGSGASGDEHHALSPDSPIPDYKEAVREHVIINVGYRSPSPESVDSDVEYTLGELLIAMGFGVEDRPDSPQSIEYQMQDRSSVVECTAMSPDAWMLLRSIKSGSQESVEDNNRLSPDLSHPSFTQNVHETVIQETYTGVSSTESVLPYMAYDFVSSVSDDKRLDDKRTLSPQSERSDFGYIPESTVSDFTETFVKSTMTAISHPSTAFSYSKDVLQSSVLFNTEERTDPSESMKSGTEHLLVPKFSLDETSDGTIPKIPVEPLSSEQSPIMAAEYSLLHKAEHWKLISQVHDPQYAGETFMQFIGNINKYELNVTEHELDNRIQNRNDKDDSSLLTHSGVTHQFTCTETERAMTDTQLAQSPPPMIEHISLSGRPLNRWSKYAFESPEAPSWSDNLLSRSISDKESDYLYSSLECMCPYLHRVEGARETPESTKSVSEFRPLSPDSPLPQFSLAFPECVSYLRSTSSSVTQASDIDFFQWDLVSDFVESRLSSPESVLSEDQDTSRMTLSSQSLPEYRPVSFQSVMYMADQRASSPESVSEFVQNRPFSPDPPIFQFTPTLQVNLIKQGASYPSSESESSADFILMSDGNTNRPPSPESVTSISDLSRLLPDSPVPEFMRILSSYFMDPTPFDRSPSPVSLSSDSEFVALPVECWIDNNPRPLSPDSLGSEKEFCCDDEILVFNSNVSSFTWTSSIEPEQSLSFPQNNSETMSPSLITSVHERSAKEHWPHLQQLTESKSELWTSNKDLLCGSEADEDIKKDLCLKPLLKYAKEKETKAQEKSGEQESKAALHRVRMEA